MKKKILTIILFLVIAAFLSSGGYLYYNLYQPNVIQSGKLYIPTGATFNQVRDSLQPFLKNKSTLSTAIKFKKIQVHPGRYTLTKGWSNDELINKLRSGEQDDISIRIGNYSSIYELAGRVAPYLECDSQQIVAAILNTNFANGLDSDALLYYFIPNTYNFHWNLSGQEFVQKMKNFYTGFWDQERLSAAKAENMTPLQVTILASIVQLESVHSDEQPRVARLYLNRLQQNMKLDADPTVIFAMRKAYGRDIKVNRVYYKNLLIPSPFNTYRNKGLPPGPICMPNASAIDAVLHPANHDYLYFVADPSQPGYHIYAHTLAEQSRNAQKYRNWIDSVQKMDTAK